MPFTTMTGDELKQAREDSKGRKAIPTFNDAERDLVLSAISTEIERLCDLHDMYSEHGITGERLDKLEADAFVLSRIRKRMAVAGYGYLSLHIE